MGSGFYDELLTGREDLSPVTVAKVKEMVKDCKSQQEAAKLIYEYAQKKNRYVSVQIGIGGFQPMKASEVDALSYGDCKALVNYTSALLHAVGIEAIYTEIYAGTEKIDYLKDFASISQGNHIILCLPFQNDTTWLECTSKDAPFGYLGSFTQGRRALLIKKEGGELVKTPSLKWNNNLQLRNARFELQPAGNLKGTVNTSFSGIQYENREGFNALTPKEKQERIKSVYAHIPDFEIHAYRLEEAETLPLWNEELELSSAHFGNKNGEFLAFDLNPLNVSNRSLKEVINRKNEVYINVGWLDADTISIKIPENYQIENLPNNIQKSYAFGSYELKTVVQGNELLTIRKMILKEGIYPAEAYNELVDFYELARKYDKGRCILKSRDKNEI